MGSAGAQSAGAHKAGFNEFGTEHIAPRDIVFLNSSFYLYSIITKTYINYDDTVSLPRGDDATMKKNEVKLTAEQRNELENFSKTGAHNVKLIKRAKIILLLDEADRGKTVMSLKISRRLNACVTTITKVKKVSLR